MTTTSRPAHAIAWRNAVFAVFALNGLGAATWAIRIPSIRDQLELPVSWVGYLILGVSVGSIIGLVLASHVLQWLGGRRSIAIMLVLCAFALLVIGLGTSAVGSFALVVVGMGIYGFGSAICDVAMNVEGAAVEKVIGKTIMPLLHASWSAGMVIGTSVGTLLVFQHVPVGVHALGMAVLLVLGAFIAPRAIPRVATHADTGEEVAHVSFRDRMSIWLEPRTLAIGLIALGMAFTEGSANDWLALGMVDDRGLENGQGAALFTVFTAAMMIGRIAGGPLIDRFGRVPVLWATGASAAVGLALVIFVPIIPIAVVGAEETMPILFKVPSLARVVGAPYFPITANMAFGPLGALTPFPAKFKLRVLDPITFDDVEPDQPRYSRSRIMEESEAIRQQIQEALFDMLRRRRSVWFG